MVGHIFYFASPYKQAVVRFPPLVRHLHDAG